MATDAANTPTLSEDLAQVGAQFISGNHSYASIMEANFFHHITDMQAELELMQAQRNTEAEVKKPAKT